MDTPTHIEPKQDDDFGRALRPTKLCDFVGQEQAKKNLEVYIQSAKYRGESLDHTLLSGPPGLGKTTLANIVANEMGANLHVVNSPSIRQKGELAGLLISLKKNDILFLDEIHALHPKVEEILYTAMEDYKLEVVAGQGALSTAICIDLNPFTLIGATTRDGMLTRPLRDRFGEIVQMQLYTEDELTSIVISSSKKLGITPTHDGARELARRARGTPRIVNRLLRRVRDFTQFGGQSELTVDTVKYTCNRLGIDSAGLDRVSQRYLSILAERGIPISLNNMSSFVNETRETIEESIEPNLLRFGFIELTPKGRIITRKGMSHLFGEQ